ncbi:BTAD domain-containing putative transcriptional regulator [Phytomonospora sp. NPDC050363]|uniref:AfsR/SARP family transcriptional regulator n=1 Tax=Phytomonospora sp. NPDC050363 TaxID=3155642 RepID=UPI0033DA683D
MRFGVLGAVDVRTEDGVRVEIPEAKVRALLAVLLTVPGKVVSADRLIRDLWDGELPANPANALQHKVSQLRGVFDKAEPGARKLVVHRAPGYLLDVPADAVDVGRFRLLLREARATKDAAERAALLGEALAACGSPDDIDDDNPVLRVARAEYFADLIAAIEERGAALLEIGDHARALDGVRGLMSGNFPALHGHSPHRPLARSVHMRALYGLGRQAEALDSFAQFRDRLAEETGLDPSPDLVALHHAILRQDPSLGPPPAAIAPPRTNLPAPVGEIIGRDADVPAVVAALGAGRLVTLTGPGGVGKTRLAVEAARSFDDRPVWFLDLAGLAAGAGAETLIDVLATTLGLRDEAAADPAVALRAVPTLLVVDNCEHVVDAAACVVSRLLREVPGLRVLATGQEPLSVGGENVHPVAPLPAEAAAELFRSLATVPSDVDAARAVAAICARLDGIPLALELAATRVRTLGLHGLAQRLDERFTLLTGGGRDAPGRHRTLRAMIDWSWELATVAERETLRRLSVHAGGWTLAAAGTVAGRDVLDELTRLVDRSLVAMTDTTAGPRYRLLESVRAYAAERLEEAGETRETALRHLAHYLAEATRHLSLVDDLRFADTEAPNLRAALGTALAEADERARTLVDALAWPQILNGRYAETARSLDAVLALGEDAKLRVWRTGVALLAGESCDADLRALAEAVPEKERPWAFWFLAHANRGFGDLDVTAALADTAIETAGYEVSLAAAARAVRASVHRVRGDFAAAEADAAAVVRFEMFADPWTLSTATGTLAVVAEIRGDYDRAERLHGKALRSAEELGLWIEASFQRSGLGRIALLRGDHAAADDHHARAAELARAQGHVVAEEFAEVGLALSARRQGRHAEAERLLARWVDWLRTVDGEPGLALVLAELGFAAEQLGDHAKALRLHRDGLAAARRIGDPRAVALAFEGMAGAHAADGEPALAARLLGAAATLRESVGAPLPAGERGDVERIGARVREALGEAGFSAEFATALAPETVSDGS